MQQSWHRLHCTLKGSLVGGKSPHGEQIFCPRVSLRLHNKKIWTCASKITGIKTILILVVSSPGRGVWYSICQCWWSCPLLSLVYPPPAHVINPLPSPTLPHPYPILWSIYLLKWASLLISALAERLQSSTSSTNRHITTFSTALMHRLAQSECTFWQLERGIELGH